MLIPFSPSYLLLCKQWIVSTLGADAGGHLRTARPRWTTYLPRYQHVARRTHKPIPRRGQWRESRIVCFLMRANGQLRPRMLSVPRDRDGAERISLVSGLIGDQTPRRAVMAIMGPDEHPLSGCRRAVAGSPPACKRTGGLVSVRLMATLKACGRPESLVLPCDSCAVRATDVTSFDCATTRRPPTNHRPVVNETAGTLYPNSNTVL